MTDLDFFTKPHIVNYETTIPRQQLRLAKRKEREREREKNSSRVSRVHNVLHILHVLYGELFSFV